MSRESILAELKRLDDEAKLRQENAQREEAERQAKIRQAMADCEAARAKAQRALGG